MNDCVFRIACDTPDCIKPCAMKLEFDYLVKASNLPARFAKPVKLYPESVDFEAFKKLAAIKESVLDFVKDGKFLYLYSTNTGNGKTSFASKILLTYLALSASGNGFKELAYFIYLPELLLLTTDFDNEQRTNIISTMKSTSLLILDDIGAIISNSSFTNSYLAAIIDTRYANSRATIFTSNLNPTSLINVVGARLADRILSGDTIELKGRSRR